jgi:hypothetical protein
METVEGKIIEENEVNRNGGGCSSCKQKGIKKGQIGSVILGIYIMSSAVYGTIVLISKLLTIIK